MVQYHFAGDKHEIVKVPHGNSKGSTPYKRTKQSTLDRLKEVCVSKYPSDACIIVEQEVGGVLIDPTFDLGNFYVTPICFLHPMFINRDTGRNPLFIGPILIHKVMNFQAYHFFASQLVNLCPDFASLKCFGTDGEKALYQAFSSVFPQAIHLRCFNHFKANIKDKLKDLHFEQHSLHSIIADIWVVLLVE